VIERRQACVMTPTKISLAQFSKNLMSSESQGRPDCVGATTAGIGPQSLGGKRFAAGVVAAMSSPTLGSNPAPAPGFNEEPSEHLLRTVAMAATLVTRPK
jgi:hypothetical protein